MKMYLSSYELGNEANQHKLKEMLPTNKKVGYIFNAMDAGADPKRRAERIQRNMEELNALGFDSFELDLKAYFGKQEELASLIDTLGAIWVCGGNVFILRQAYRLSGFDEILINLSQQEDFLYGAYSAGCCVLSPSLKGLHLVDDASSMPYDELDEVIWEGLGIIDYAFLPHFDSDHGESSAINKVLAYCKANGLHYKTIRDGDVIIAE